MNTRLNGKAVVSGVMLLTLLLGGLMLTACSGQGGFSFDFGQGQDPSGGGGAAGFSPMILLLLIIFLVAIVAVVALGSLGKK